MQIIMRRVDELKNFENNARVHSDSQISQLCESIKEFGFNDPIEIDANGVVISGHARLAAALRLGFSEVPTITHSHLSKAAQRAYTVAANKIATSATWDIDILRTEFEELKIEDIDLSLTGFSDDEIANILEPAADVTNDDDDENQEKIVENPKSKNGDVWILGNHRLMCGDSTSATDVEKLYNGLSPVLMVTDPPYGVNYDPEWRNEKLGSRVKRKDLKNDHLADWSESYALFTGSVAYVWHASLYAHIVAKNLIDCGYDLISQIVWNKNHFVISRGDYHWKHESCWYAVKKNHKHNWRGKRDQVTVWDITKTRDKKDDTMHGTQKPLECMSRPIQNNSKSGGVIYDPFGGSGTTLIACEKLQRRCLMMEIDERYIDVIIKRWQKQTGQHAILESTGEMYAC